MSFLAREAREEQRERQAVQRGLLEEQINAQSAARSQERAAHVREVLAERAELGLPAADAHDFLSAQARREAKRHDHVGGDQVPDNMGAVPEDRPPRRHVEPIEMARSPTKAREIAPGFVSSPTGKQDKYMSAITQMHGDPEERASRRDRELEHRRILESQIAEKKKHKEAVDEDRRRERDRELHDLDPVGVDHYKPSCRRRDPNASSNAVLHSNRKEPPRHVDDHHVPNHHHFPPVVAEAGRNTKNPLVRAVASAEDMLDQRYSEQGPSSPSSSDHHHHHQEPRRASSVEGDVASMFKKLLTEQESLKEEFHTLQRATLDKEKKKPTRHKDDDVESVMRTQSQQSRRLAHDLSRATTAPSQADDMAPRHTTVESKRRRPGKQQQQQHRRLPKEDHDDPGLLLLLQGEDEDSASRRPPRQAEPPVHQGRRNRWGGLIEDDGASPRKRKNKEKIGFAFGRAKPHEPRKPRPKPSRRPLMVKRAYYDDDESNNGRLPRLNPLRPSNAAPASPSRRPAHSPIRGAISPEKQAAPTRLPAILRRGSSKKMMNDDDDDDDNHRSSKKKKKKKKKKTTTEVRDDSPDRHRSSSSKPERRLDFSPARRPLHHDDEAPPATPPPPAQPHHGSAFDPNEAELRSTTRWWPLNPGDAHQDDVF